jgi:hypothetical protein
LADCFWHDEISSERPAHWSFTFSALDPEQSGVRLYFQTLIPFGGGRRVRYVGAALATKVQSCERWRPLPVLATDRTTNSGFLWRLQMARAAFR